MTVKATSAKGIALQERRELAVELRKAGYSYREIARLVKRQLSDQPLDNYDHTLAYKDVKYVMQEMVARSDTNGKHLVMMELTRIDHLLMACWARATEGEIASIRMAKELSEFRAQLLNLFEIGAGLTRDADAGNSDVPAGTIGYIVEVNKNYGAA